MDKKHYNDIIKHTLRCEQSAQTDDSLKTARAIFNNMGVALPQGDIKEVYEIIKTNDYMGWKSCTMQEAQAAADNGIAAIGISEDRIVVLSANDEEQPVTQTAAVMTFSENTSTYALEELQYYSYSNDTTGNNREFNSNYLINQGSTSILYPSGEKPGAESRAFVDTLFYGSVCGKTLASGNIRQYGCAICSLAMFLLYKGNKTNVNNNVYYAVKEATIQGTNIYADLLGGSFSVSYNNGSSCVTATVAPTDNPDYELNRGNCCIFRINGNPSHFILVYGIVSGKTGTDKYLVADPDGGKLMTLSEAIRKRGLAANMSNIGNMRVVS